MKLYDENYMQLNCVMQIDGLVTNQLSIRSFIACEI